jgi:hypothetical protein
MSGGPLAEARMRAYDDLAGFDHQFKIFHSQIHIGDARLGKSRRSSTKFAETATKPSGKTARPPLRSCGRLIVGVVRAALIDPDRASLSISLPS